MNSSIIIPNFIISNEIKQNILIYKRNKKDINKYCLFEKNENNKLLPTIYSTNQSVKQMKTTLIKKHIKNGKTYYTDKFFLYIKKSFRNKLKDHIFPNTDYSQIIKKEVKNHFFINYKKKIQKNIFYSIFLKMIKKIYFNDIFSCFKSLLPFFSLMVLKKIPKKRNKRFFYIKILNKIEQIKHSFKFNSFSFENTSNELFDQIQMIEKKEEWNKNIQFDKYNIRLPRLPKEKEKDRRKRKKKMKKRLKKK